ncbi:paraquat-inducible protein A [Variovorax sp. OV329]|uniref:paraquat-inducible protein A n=1 Tax=Variovorax sp. OV329 TaxID=1882825 RepID=UPI0008E5EB48|nr:paraquat-inducible protein A [Variovorax sp. OV329]SFN10544.1 paraquat-inducible protein A [Variovorax sp. OV329]
MQEVPDLIACEGCDALYERPRLRPREAAHCPRCGTLMERGWGRAHERMLPLTVACLILFAIANLFPIVEIQLQGLSSETTLVGAVVQLTHGGVSEVALLVLATTILFPLAQLCILFYLLVSITTRGVRPAGFNILVRAMQVLRPWGMIEVFLLGVLVAIVKLSGMARVIPGAALWAFMVLTVLLTAVLAFEPKAFWRIVFAREQAREDQTRP